MGEPAGTCWADGLPTHDRRSYHLECRDDWLTWHDPARAAHATFVRDNFTCRVCRRQLPESMLECDHVIPQWRGGESEPGNYQTLCVDDHAEKTAREETERARYDEDARARAQKEGRVTAREHEKNKPSSKAAAATTAKTAVAAGAAPWAYTLGDAIVGVFGRDWPDVAGGPGWLSGTAALGVVFAGTFRHNRRARAHALRLIEYRVWEQLANVTRDDKTAVDRLTVHEWGHDEGGAPIPLDVTLQHGATFDPTRNSDLQRILSAFATITVPGSAVRHRVLSGGRLRLWLPEPNADDDETPVEQSASTSSAEPGQVGPTEGRICAALMKDVDRDVRAEVRAIHDDGTPREVLFAFPPRATSNVRENRIGIVDTMQDLHPAAGRWVWRASGAPDSFVLIDEPDSLRHLVPLPPIEKEVDLEKGVVIGVLEDGTPWRVPLAGGAQVLVAGQTGSGKGSIPWNIIRGLSHMIACGTVRLTIVDPKSGLEFSLAEAITGRDRFAVKYDEVTDLLARVVREMEAKGDRIRAAKIGRKVPKPTRDFPLDLVIVDEIADVVGSAAAESKKENAPLLVKGLTQGRAPLTTFVACVQAPQKSNLEQRDQFTHRIVLRQSSANDVNTILPGGRADGALADRIPDTPEGKGIGYVYRHGTSGYLRGRAAYVSEEETSRIVDHIVELRAEYEAEQVQAPPIGELRGWGEQDALPSLTAPDAPPNGAPPARRRASRAVQQLERPERSVLAVARASGEQVSVLALAEGDRAVIDGENDVIVVAGVVEDPDEAAQWGEDGRTVTYLYEGEKSAPRSVWFPHSDQFLRLPD